MEGTPGKEVLAGGLNSEFSWLSGTALKIAPLGIFFKKVPETTVRGTTNQFPCIKKRCWKGYTTAIIFVRFCLLY